MFLSLVWYWCWIGGHQYAIKNRSTAPWSVKKIMQLLFTDTGNYNETTQSIIDKWTRRANKYRQRKLMVIMHKHQEMVMGSPRWRQCEEEITWKLVEMNSSYRNLREHGMWRQWWFHWCSKHSGLWLFARTNSSTLIMLKSTDTV